MGILAPATGSRDRLAPRRGATMARHGHGAGFGGGRTGPRSPDRGDPSHNTMSGSVPVTMMPTLMLAYASSVPFQPVGPMM